MLIIYILVILKIGMGKLVIIKRKFFFGRFWFK